MSSGTALSRCFCSVSGASATRAASHCRTVKYCAGSCTCCIPGSSAVLLTGGNRNDVTRLLPLLDAIPPVRGRVGRPRRKPDSLFADRGYDHDIYRDQVRARGIVPAIARRGTRHGTGPGTHRWVVERTFAWLHGFRRLRVRWERRADIHEAFLKLACCLITHRQLGSLR